MKKKITVLLLLTSVLSFGQQEPQFSMPWNNYSLYNPANTGVNNQHFSNITYRLAYLGISNNPQYITANYETKIDKINSGIGLGYIFDKKGVGESQKIRLNYAYHLTFKNNNSLSFGISGDYQLNKFNPNWNPPEFPTDPNLPEAISQGKINLNGGLLFKTKRLEVGVGLTQINQPYFDNLNFTNQRHINVMASYKIQLITDLVYKPSIYFISDFIAGSLQINNQFVLKEKYFLGLMYRHTDAVGIQLGATFFKNFQIAYGFDLLTGPLTQFENSHEVALTFRIK